jgi:hypothetical protein
MACRKSRGLCWSYGICGKCFMYRGIWIERDKIRLQKRYYDNIEENKIKRQQYYQNNKERQLTRKRIRKTEKGNQILSPTTLTISSAKSRIRSYGRKIVAL